VWGRPRLARGPWGGAVMVAPPWVTPGPSGTGQVPSGSAVRDGHRQRAAGGWAARGGTAGDVRGTGQVPVPAEAARPAGEDPAGRLGYPAVARGAGGGGAPLVRQHHRDPGLGGLVGQVADEGGGPPGAQPHVVPPPGLDGEHVARVTHGQGAYPPRRRPGDHHFGGLMLGLPDPAPVTGLDSALAGPVFAPPPRPGLTRPRGAPGHRPAAAFGVGQVQVVLRAQRPPRHQQPLPARARDGVRVNDAQVHPGHPPRIGRTSGRIDRHRDFGGHLHKQPTALGQQRDRPTWLSG